MPWNGAGVYTRIFNWVSDAAASIDITASRVDGDADDRTAGLNNCLTKDGQNTPVNVLPMGGFRHTGVQNAQARTDYAAAGQVADGSLVWGGTSTGSSNAQVISPTPVVSALVDGQSFSFRSGFTNSGATTLSAGGVGPQPVTYGGGALIGSEIRVGLNYVVSWNSSANRFELTTNSNGDFASGTKLLFPQATAPVGWTQDADANDMVLRVVNTAGAGTGGSWTISGTTVTIAGHALTSGENGSHTHTVTDAGHHHAPTTGSFVTTNSAAVNLSGGGGLMFDSNANTATATTGIAIDNSGSGTAHGHPGSTFTNDATWRPAYLDVIKATKN